MLLIHCPYCGERPEIEFSYGGQAHLARPADPQALSDQEWADYLYMRRNPQGRACRALAPRARLLRASSMRCATRAPIRSWRPIASASRAQLGAEGGAS